MPTLLDTEWFCEIAADAGTKESILDIAEMQRRALESNELSDDFSPLELQLLGFRIWMERASAFSTLEVFQEIFRDNDHALISGFGGEDARTIVDLGANHGFYALRTKRRNPKCRIVCLEPNPHVFQMLKRNVGNVASPQIETLWTAVAAQDGELPMDIVRQIPAIGGMALHQVERPWMRPEFAQHIVVPGVTLERVLCEREIDAVDILKVDIEGGEVAVLEAAKGSLSRIQKIVVERHSLADRKLLKIVLASAGFQLVHEEDADGHRYYADMYFDRSQT